MKHSESISTAIFHVKHCKLLVSIMFHVKHSESISTAMFHVKHCKLLVSIMFHVKHLGKRILLCHAICTRQ